MAELFIPTIDEMRDQFLDDLELAAIEEGIDDPPIQPGTDWYALATAEANLHGISLQNLKLAAEDITPLTAAEPKLDEWRKSLGLPEVLPSAALGKVRVETTGSAALPAGTALTHSTGVRYAVASSYFSVQNNDEVDIIALDLGTKGNRQPGDVLSFVSPPPNIRRAAYVSSSEPVTGGTDTENAEAKRARILNRTANAPSGGNWGYLVEQAKLASPGVQGAYVYPALGGPASVKVAITQAFNRDVGDWTRSPTDALVTLVRNRLHGLMADGVEVIVQGAADEYVDVALEIEIPDSLLAGGDGTGWIDAAPWPPLDGADTRVSVSVVTSSRQVTVNASTTTAPIAGQTHVAWWNSYDQRFEQRLITAQSGSTGAWVLTLDAPLVSDAGDIVAVGDWICPAAVNLTGYGETWRDALEVLGPGENTADQARLPRALRHPIVSSANPVSLTKSLVRSLLNKHPEILEVDYTYRSLTTPTVPGSVSGAPTVLVLRRFGVYPV
jgi:uncharacterized phage protein gp47/JayE